MSTLLVVFAVFITVVAIVALVITTGVNSRSEVSLSGEATMYYSFGTVTNARMLPGSTDAAGSVLGALSGSGTFEVIVHFSKTYSVAPKAVILTPATPPSGVPLAGYLLTVDNITTAGFEMIGSSTTLLSDQTLFYYAVI